MPSWTKVRVAGPLAPYAPGFGRELRGCGYTDLSTAEQLRLMSHLSRWMARERLGVLGGEQVAAYCAARKAEGYVARLTPGSLGRLLVFLRAQGVMPASPAAWHRRMICTWCWIISAEAVGSRADKASTCPPLHATYSMADMCRLMTAALPVLPSLTVVLPGRATRPNGDAFLRRRREPGIHLASCIR